MTPVGQTPFCFEIIEKTNGLRFILLQMTKECY